MFSQLSQGMKNSVTRSIKTAFEDYMRSIEWNPEKFDEVIFLASWQQTFTTGALWYKNIDSDFKSSQAFHEELAQKVNQIIEKSLTENVTEDQMHRLIAKFGEDFANEVTCKLEAKYYLEK